MYDDFASISALDDLFPVYGFAKAVLSITLCPDQPKGWPISAGI